MNKPRLLRRALAARFPDLARDADRLAMWVEKGKVRARLGNSHSFAWEYDLVVLVSAFTGAEADLFHCLCEWLREQQPELLASGADGFPFEVDILDENLCDVQVTLTLDEAVTAVKGADGQWQCTTVPQPVPLIPDIGQIGPGLTSIWADGRQVAPRPLD